MAFDDELRRTIDSLTDRVRQEIARQLAGVTDELTAAAAAERRAAAFDAAASARTAAEEQADTRLAEALAAANDAAAAAERAAEARGREQGREEGRDAGYRLGREAGLAEGRAEGEQAARVELSDAAALAAERLVDAFRAMDRAQSLTDILDTLANSAMREAARVAVLVAEGEMLRAWRVIGFPAASDGSGVIETPATGAGVLAEAVSTSLPVTHASSSSGAPAFAALPDGRPFAALPIALAGDVVAVLYADQGPDMPAVPAAAHWTAVVEVLVRHAARCLEAVTAVRAAQALRMPAPVRGTSAADEEDAARRYAKLLVSEIKLYHEADVQAGRRERDLATRLGGEIARARVLYEQRVPPHARRGTDYFHAELVRMLADGDASLLEVRQ